MSEISLSQLEFDLLRRLVRQQIGVSLGDGKRVLVESRLRRRVRALGTPTFLSYYRKLCDGTAPEGELQELIDAITTHTTAFFREQIHFDYLAQELVPAWARRSSGPRVNRIRLWSAACSTGQEPYSLSAALRAKLPDLQRFDAKILGTDVSLGALRQAENACYPVNALDEIPEAFRVFFKARGVGASRHVAVSAELRSLVVLRPLNLMADAYPFRGLFDAIFCRNVLIYFDGPTKQALIAKMTRFLAPGGHLFLGLAEPLIRVPEGLRSLGHSIYERTFDPPPTPLV